MKQSTLDDRRERHPIDGHKFVQFETFVRRQLQHHPGDPEAAAREDIYDAFIEGLDVTRAARRVSGKPALW